MSRDTDFLFWTLFTDATEAKLVLELIQHLLAEKEDKEVGCMIADKLILEPMEAEIGRETSYVGWIVEGMSW